MGSKVCGHEAVLIVTRSVRGTSTSVARSRTPLRCDLTAGHGGKHKDSRHDEEWPGKKGEHPTLLRHQEEDD
jgi:hypothetical protein